MLCVLWKYGKTWQKLKQRNNDVYLCIQVIVILLASSSVLILERFKDLRAKIG